MSKTLLVFILIMPPYLVKAEKGGLVSGEFLSLGAGARAISMGETGTASVDDSYASWWNPAALTRLKTPEIALMHNQHFEGIAQQYLAVAYPSSRYSTALNITRLAAKPFNSYDGNGNSLGETQASGLSLGLAFGLKLQKNFSLGATGKWLQERLDTNKAQAFASDFGMLYEFVPRQSFPALEALKLGASYSNLSRGLKFERDRFSLPETLRLGASSQHHLFKQRFSLSLEGVLPKKSEPFISFGSEWQVQDFLAFRLGWRGSQDIGSGLRLGFGIKIQQFSLDYAWAGFGDFGGTHRISLKIQFGSLFNFPQTFSQTPVLEAPTIQKPAPQEIGASEPQKLTRQESATLSQSRFQNVSIAAKTTLESNLLQPTDAYHQKDFPWRTPLASLAILGGTVFFTIAVVRKLKN